MIFINNYYYLFCPPPPSGRTLWDTSPNVYNYETPCYKVMHIKFDQNLARTFKDVENMNFPFTTLTPKFLICLSINPLVKGVKTT